MRIWFVSLIVALAATAPAAAQTAVPGSGRAVVTAVDVSQFPDVQAYVAVQDDRGQHVAGLPASAFQVNEDGSDAGPVAVLEADIGLQMVFAFDVGPGFKARDVNAVTRLEYLTGALAGFLGAGPEGTDDVTLLTSDGPLVAHVSTAGPVTDALARYAPRFEGAADPYALLNSGLNYASDVPPRPGMRRALILAASGLPAEPPNALPDAELRAQAAGIQVYTVFVGPAGGQAAPAAQALRRLAEATGGQFLTLEGRESLAPVFAALAAQRPQYRLSYRSAIKATGQHALNVQVLPPAGGPWRALPASFQVRVEAPTVSLVNTPTRLALSEVGPEAEVAFEVAFPDGHPRRLATALLVVDGQPVPAAAAVETSALAWPLSGYAVGITHTLQVRVTDELGLSADSRPAEVLLEAGPAPAQPAAPLGALPVEAYWAAGTVLLAVALAGAAAAIWLVGGRPGRGGTAARPVRPAEALGQTVPVQPARPRATRLRLPSLHLPELRPRRQALGRAYLEVVAADAGPKPGTTFEVLGPELRLGRDPRQAEAVLADPSVSRLHARLVENPPGTFRILDAGSTSGTWVNFTPVPAEHGLELRPGDLIHVGRVQLRFQPRR